MPWDLTWLCNCMLFVQWVLVVAASFERNQILRSILGPSVITNSDISVSGRLFSSVKGWAFPRFLFPATSCMTNRCAVSHPGWRRYTVGTLDTTNTLKLKKFLLWSASSLTVLLPSTLQLANSVRPCGHSPCGEHSPVLLLGAMGQELGEGTGEATSLSSEETSTARMDLEKKIGDGVFSPILLFSSCNRKKTEAAGSSVWHGEVNFLMPSIKHHSRLTLIGPPRN